MNNQYGRLRIDLKYDKNLNKVFFKFLKKNNKKVTKKFITDDFKNIHIFIEVLNNDDANHVYSLVDKFKAYERKEKIKKVLDEE